MTKAPDLRESIPPPKEVIDAGKDGNLVLFVGAGVSRLLGFPSWPELAQQALEDLRASRYLNFSEIDQLKNLEPRKQLSIAKLLCEQNNTALDLAKHLQTKNAAGTIYESINKIGCPCVTTNYDEMLSPTFNITKDGSATASPTNRVSERRKFFPKLLNAPGTVVHLHGCISKPETMIVTTKDYLEHYDDENVKEFLGGMFEQKTVVFIGYGLEETEILEHILRRGRVGEEEIRRRFVLQGFFQSEKPLYNSLHNYYEKSFGVHLLGFIRDHENYAGLRQTVKLWASEIEVNSPPLVEDLDYMEDVLNNG